jgi:hypothetical protein
MSDFISASVETVFFVAIAVYVDSMPDYPMFFGPIYVPSSPS